MIDGYLLTKWVHILSSTVLFGTGLGTALQMFLAHREGNVRAIATVDRNVVRADWLCTLPSGIVQPISGLILIDFAHLDPFAPWLFLVYVLYSIAGLCWIIVVVLQLRMARVATDVASFGAVLPIGYWRMYRAWFWLGWPAFLSLVAIFVLMVFKPDL